MSDLFQFSDLTKTTADSEAWRKGSLQMPGNDSPRDQWLRKLNLTVYGDNQEGINISDLRVDFNITKNTNLTPNLFYAKVYNLAPQTMAKVIEFKQVQLSAGYQKGNYGIIFDGTVVQYVRGKETAVDTYLEIFGGDGDRALNNAVLLKTIPAGSTDRQLYDAAIATLKELGVKEGHTASGMDKEKSPRAQTKAMDARRVLRDLTLKYKMDFYIDDGKANLVERGGYLPGEAVVLAPNTGLVGMPRVTPQGIEATCLLNSKLRLGGLVKIESSILTGVPYLPGTASKTDAQGNVIPGDPNIPLAERMPVATWGAQLNAAFTSPIGLYKILLLNHAGDTRGNPWYSQLICIAIASDGGVMPTANPADAYSRASGNALGNSFVTKTSL